MKPQAFIFIGRYASGKGTQANLLIEALKKTDPSHPPLYMEAGKKFRQFILEDNHTAKLSKQVVESGGLMPEFMPIYIWAKQLVELYTGNEHLVFDGSPRKILEAKIFDTTFPFYGIEKPWVIYLDVEHDESHRRLKIRAQTSGRPDDGDKEIENRRKAHEEDIVPVIEYFRDSPKVRFLDIDGERTIEEVHTDIVEKIGLK